MDISIIIPVYNAEKFIENCLNSIIKQKEHNLSFEIIAVNDGSRDNSLKILNKFAVAFSNITVIDSENKGAGSARNTGMKIAVGNYFWFVDADDYIIEDSFKNLQIDIKNQISDLVVFDYNIVNISDSREVKSNFPNNEVTLLNYFANAQALFLWKHLYKSELIVNNNLNFIEGIKNIEDFEFNLRFFFLAGTISYIEKAFYNYFENLSSTSRDISKENLKKLALDSHIVHSSLQMMIIDNQVDNQVIIDLLGKSIVGFFYSLFKWGYTYDDAKYYFNIYNKENLLPTKIKHKNLKFRVFEYLVNTRYSYLILSFIKKKIFFK